MYWLLLLVVVPVALAELDALAEPFARMTTRDDPLAVLVAFAVPVVG
jgi:hypothetical protein